MPRRFAAPLLTAAALAAGVVGVALGFEGTARAQASASTPHDGRPHRAPDVPYEPSPPEVVDAMLKLARVSERDVLFDLGSGDGRIVIAAARTYGARAVGIDIDPQRIHEANENARRAGVADRVRFVQADLFEADFRDATVVTMYLWPHVNLRLRPRLEALPEGTRIVSHSHDMGDWKPDVTIEVATPNREHRVHLWVVRKASNR